jgi:hypothetical protein
MEVMATVDSLPLERKTDSVQQSGDAMVLDAEING